MKMIAYIFLLIFTVIQIVPAAQSICNDLQVSIFNPDEEKGTEKVNGNSIEEIKEKKIYCQNYVFAGAAGKAALMVSFQGNKDKLPLPILDMIILPPNFA